MEYSSLYNFDQHVITAISGRTLEDVNVLKKNLDFSTPGFSLYFIKQYQFLYFILAYHFHQWFVDEWEPIG